MKCTFSEIRNKEIICTGDGARLGYADDMEIDMGFRPHVEEW